MVEHSYPTSEKGLHDLFTHANNEIYSAHAFLVAEINKPNYRELFSAAQKLSPSHDTVPMDLGLLMTALGPQSIADSVVDGLSEAVNSEPVALDTAE